MDVTLASNPTNAAHNLLGRTLASGWKVIEKIGKAEYSSGAFFSVCYKVTKDGEICFLKAFDFEKFFSLSDGKKGVMDVLGDMITAFRYERSLSSLCKFGKVTKVAFVKDSGEELVEGYQISVVPYLIFDLADGDIRKKMALTRDLDDLFRLNSLHSVAIGLSQLHKLKVSHQDLKPSNILLFNDESKIGDIGRSVSDEISSPYDDMSYSGDISYAPPEIIYQFFNPDKNLRNFATDCYLLGSLIVFYFSGVSMNHMLSKYIPGDLMWNVWNGGFTEIEKYLLDAFAKSLEEFENTIPNKQLGKELRKIVHDLCYPIPEQRGHPKNFDVRGEKYGLNRFISTLDLLRRKIENKMIN
jgi:eukaryotic-like serine/threonine-protein kinase